MSSKCTPLTKVSTIFGASMFITLICSDYAYTLSSSFQKSEDILINLSKEWKIEKDTHNKFLVRIKRAKSFCPPKVSFVCSRISYCFLCLLYKLSFFVCISQQILTSTSKEKCMLHLQKAGFFQSERLSEAWEDMSWDRKEANVSRRLRSCCEETKNAQSCGCKTWKRKGIQRCPKLPSFSDWWLLYRRTQPCKSLLFFKFFFIRGWTPNWSLKLAALLQDPVQDNIWLQGDPGFPFQETWIKFPTGIS